MEWDPLTRTAGAVLAVSIACLLVATPAAGAFSASHETRGGGVEVLTPLPQTPVSAFPLLGEPVPLLAKAAAGATTCGPLAEDPNPGGACFDVAPAAEERVLRVTFEPDDPSTGTATIAAGYDLDGDGCVGCTTADRLAIGADGHVLVPTLEGADTLAVFVSAGSADLSDPGFDPQASASGTVSVTGAPDQAVGDRAGVEAFDTVAQAPAHVCVPTCSAG